MSEPVVKMSLGYTKNMGNFESLRMDVGVEFEKRPTENLDQAFERAYDKLEQELIRFFTRAVNELGE